MDRAIRCVKVDNDTRRRLVVRTYEHIDKKVVGLAASENNLLIAAFAVGANRGKFKPVERAFARKSIAPPSVVMIPPSKVATTSRRFWA